MSQVLKISRASGRPEHNCIHFAFQQPTSSGNITWTAIFLFSTKFEFDSIFPRKASQYGHCIRRILTHTCSIKLNMTGLNGVSHSYTLHTALTTIKWIVRAIAEQCCLGFISSCLKFKLQNGWMVVRTVISVMIYHHSNGLMVLFLKFWLLIASISQRKVISIVCELK